MLLIIQDLEYGAAKKGYKHKVEDTGNTKYNQEYRILLILK